MPDAGDTRTPAPGTLHLEGLAPAVRRLAEPFLRDLAGVAAGRLHSLHVVGSAVTADWRERDSDVNTLLVLREMDLGTLEAVAPLGVRYRRARVAAPLVMDLPYLRRSLDVFPVEFLDLRLVHLTVAGEDVLAGVNPSLAHLRLQCEREFKARLVGLRQGYLSSTGDGDRIRQLLLRSLAGCFPLFRGVIRLVGGEVAPGRRATLDELAARTGVDVGPFRRTLEIRDAGARPAAPELKGIFEGWYLATERLCDLVDGLAV